MSERERWIVYPLLLLTMGIALRDKLGVAKEVHARRIICEQLTVSNEDAGPQVVLESTKSGGVVRAISANHTMQLVFGHENNASSLFVESATPDGLATRALFGDLRGVVSPWPLLDPRLNRIAQPTMAHPAADPGAAKSAR
jgi:hypothetical protein